MERIEPRRVLDAAAALTLPENRATSAHVLAESAGAEDLMIFVADDQVGQSLPAPGFRQTLESARLWRALVEQALQHGTADGDVVAEGGSRPAHAVASADGTVAVLIGGVPRPADVETLRAT